MQMDEDIFQFTHISSTPDNKTTIVEFNGCYVGDIIERFVEFLHGVGFTYMRFVDQGDSWLLDKKHMEDYGVKSRSSYEETYHDEDEYDDEDYSDECYDWDFENEPDIEECPVGSVVKCVSSDHSDSIRVFGLTGVVEQIKDFSPFGQTHFVRFTPENPADPPIHWWVSPECLELLMGPPASNG